MRSKERIRELFGLGDGKPDVADIIQGVGDPVELLTAPLGYFREMETNDVEYAIDTLIAEAKTKHDALAPMILYDVLKKEAKKENIGDCSPFLSMASLASIERNTTSFGVVAAYILNTFSNLDNLIRYFKVL